MFISKYVGIYNVILRKFKLNCMFKEPYCSYKTRPRFPILQINQFRQQNDKNHEESGNGASTLKLNLCIFAIFGFYISYSNSENTKQSLWLSTKDLFSVLRFIPVINAANPIESSNNHESATHKYNFIADVVDKCASSVVFIEIQDSKR